MNNVSKSTNLAVKIALLSAIALLLMYLEFPVLPAYSFLKIDLSDLPAVIGAFAFGPLAGAGIEALKNVLAMFLKGTQTGGIGELANFVVGASFVCTAGLIYKRNKTRKTAILALVASIIIMTVMGVVTNYLVFIPLYFHNLPMSEVIKYMVYGIIPFNLIKGVLISVVTILVYKRVSVIIRAESAFAGEKKEKLS